MFIFDTLGGDLVGIAVALLTVLVAYFKWSYQYWKRKNVPYLEPRMPFGNMPSPFGAKLSRGEFMKQRYDAMKSKGWRHGGLFFTSTPQYMPLDLDYVKNIMTKDFQHFTDRGIYTNVKDDPLSGHLFLLGGAKWKNLRVKLSPTFTSGKMKMMFHTLVECTPFLLEKIKNDCEKKSAIDIKEALGCFTTDIIGSCAFGLECNTFKEVNSPFRVYGRKIVSPGLWRNLKGIFAINFPKIAKFFSVTITPKDVSDFFITVVKDTVDYRETNSVTRKDFLQLLIDLKNNKLAEEEGYKHDGKTLTMEELAAQCFVFFIAGFETSSTTMTFALYELARRPELQQRVKDEIEAVLAKHDGKITYEAIQEMKYMDQVINETLRMYPPVPFVTRQCVKDYKVPDQDLVLEKGVRVVIPIIGIHHDKDYYPDPEKFDPERFSEEMVNSRHPYAHIPFGEGPRICIGMRFGLMQSKVGMTALLKNYKFTVNNKTKQPLKMKVNSFIPTAEGDIWLDAQKI